ncbi:hypothetical protein BEH94_01905, partial [Candidatus Altiarchaeales archaeon WOR_SM1_SCG]
MNISRALKDNRLMKAVTGMSINELQELTKDFERKFEKEKQSKYKEGLKNGKRKRKPGGGRTGQLKTTNEKLFFILLYFKCYPTFDLLGLMFDLNRSNANRNVQKLLPILEKTLGEVMVLPKRKIRTIKELFEMFPEVHHLFIDATERSIPRPKDNDKRKKNYSGKKKRHTKKNTVITDENREVRYLGPTIEGKKHDYGGFKDEWWGIPQPPAISCFWTDLGYLGIEKDFPDLNVMMPKKKPKGKELTDDEKGMNKLISGVRVVVEHAIGGVKRFRIVSDIFRNKIKGFDDKVMEISCGL